MFTQTTWKGRKWKCNFHERSDPKYEIIQRTKKKSYKYEERNKKSKQNGNIKTDDNAEVKTIVSRICK